MLISRAPRRRSHFWNTKRQPCAFSAIDALAPEIIQRAIAILREPPVDALPAAA